MSPSHIVLEDTQVFAELCGANDYNLSLIGSLLGTHVLTRGNELFVESDDPGVLSLFSRLISAIGTSIEEGVPATPELIIALHAELTPDGSQSLDASIENPAEEKESDISRFLDNCIQIPNGFGKVFPRSAGQSLYLQGIASHDLTFSIGPAGTGKTYLAMAYALRELLTRSKRKLILTRPVVEAGESLGFLPGDLEQKINPYLRPLYDAMEALVPYETIRRLEESRAVEVAPLAYMRGRSLANCIVILDEGQNTTKEQMKMFLTRLGEHTKAIVTGDITQIDLPKKTESGLIHAITLLAHIEEVFISRLDARDVVRSSLARKIIEAYEKE